MIKVETLLGAMVAVTMVCAGCAGGVMSSIKAMQTSYNEQASVEVCLDRLEDIDEGLKQVDTILLETPFDADSKWVDELVDLDQGKADAYRTPLKQSGAYSLPGREVAPLKVFRLHNEKILGALEPSTKAKHPSVMAALASISGEQGTLTVEKYDVVKGLNANIAALKERQATLELEADADGTAEPRKVEIAAEIEAIDTEIEGIDLKVEPAEQELFAAIEGLGASKLEAADLNTAMALFKVIGHVARMELEAVTSAATVVIQAPMAIPGLPGELQNLAMRWLDEMVKELGATAKDVSLDIKYPTDVANMSADQMGIEITGLDGVDVDSLQDRLLGRVFKFYDQAVGSPGRAVSIAGRAEFQAKFLVALSEAVANLAGATFEEAPGFEL
jgi:hypothetical protein